MSDPRASPSPMLKVPKIEIIELVNLLDSVKTNGIDIIIVIMLIDIIVPTEKNSRKSIPVEILGVVGSIANIIAALPANPCIKPITYDFTLKNGINSGRKPCFL
jgi:hypothetical protein